MQEAQPIEKKIPKAVFIVLLPSHRKMWRKHANVRELRTS